MDWLKTLVCELKEQTRFAHSSVSNNNVFEQIVVRHDACVAPNKEWWVWFVCVRFVCFFVAFTSSGLNHDDVQRVTNEFMEHIISPISSPPQGMVATTPLVTGAAGTCCKGVIDDDSARCCSSCC